MGIPHLTTCLRPFAVSVDLTKQNIVIDGPGLAYHIWGLSTQTQSRNQFEATPSYKVLGETVLQWLDELEDHQVCLKKIFFDGFLPFSKRATRVERLTGYTKQLTDYNQAWPQLIPSANTNDVPQQNATKLFKLKPAPPRFARLPAASFLVPAIIESLSRCERYRNLVEVVPGEADLYCAEYVRIHGGLVLTGDSDLLVHGLGGGAVTFFDDIELSGNGDCTLLKSTLYEAGAIVKRLGLPETHGLQALAFEMKLNPHGIFRELLQKAKKLKSISLHDTMYQEFAAEYRELQIDPLIRNIHCAQKYGAELTNQLKLLDPRISEYILQFNIFAQMAGLPEEITARFVNANGNTEIFLPFLLDCPLRTSAWEVCTSVRQLAYGLTNLLLPVEEQINAVAEYRRLQNDGRGRTWSVPTSHEIPEACASLSGLFKQLWTSMPSMPPNQIWQAVAIHQILQHDSVSGKQGVDFKIIKIFRSNQSQQFRLKWDNIHLFAQLQASYYSLRMLKQILGLVGLCGDPRSIPPTLYQLQADLESLPALSDLPGLVDAIRNIGNPGNQEILAMIQRLLNIDEREDVVVNSIQKKERRRKKNEVQPKRPKNMFELLALEECVSSSL